MQGSSQGTLPRLIIDDSDINKPHTFTEDHKLIVRHIPDEDWGNIINEAETKIEKQEEKDLNLEGMYCIEIWDHLSTIQNLEYDATITPIIKREQLIKSRLQKLKSVMDKLKESTLYDLREAPQVPPMVLPTVLTDKYHDTKGDIFALNDLLSEGLIYGTNRNGTDRRSIVIIGNKAPKSLSAYTLALEGLGDFFYSIAWFDNAIAAYDAAIKSLYGTDIEVEIAHSARTPNNIVCDYTYRYFGESGYGLLLLVKMTYAAMNLEQPQHRTHIYHTASLIAKELHWVHKNNNINYVEFETQLQAKERNALEPIIRKNLSAVPKVSKCASLTLSTEDACAALMEITKLYLRDPYGETKQQDELLYSIGIIAFTMVGSDAGRKVLMEHMKYFIATGRYHKAIFDNEIAAPFEIVCTEISSLRLHRDAILALVNNKDSSSIKELEKRINTEILLTLNSKDRNPSTTLRLYIAKIVIASLMMNELNKWSSTYFKEVHGEAIEFIRTSPAIEKDTLAFFYGQSIITAARIAMLQCAHGIKDESCITVFRSHLELHGDALKYATPCLVVSMHAMLAVSYTAIAYTIKEKKREMALQEACKHLCEIYSMGANPEDITYGLERNVVNACLKVGMARNVQDIIQHKATLLASANLTEDKDKGRILFSTSFLSAAWKDLFSSIDMKLRVSITEDGKRCFVKSNSMAAYVLKYLVEEYKGSAQGL